MEEQDPEEAGGRGGAGLRKGGELPAPAASWEDVQMELRLGLGGRPGNSLLMFLLSL